ncbi:unnamed protein product [Closterium sp. NIES-65]|nr:unnamed protein product [Closterium sp. NIES-65]
MTTDALALMAVALAEASPGGVPGSQVPALLRAVSALAGPAASSSTSLVQRRRRRRSGASESLPQLGRAPASLRPRQQQAFRRSQRQSSRLPPLGRRLAPQSQQTPPPPARPATPAPSVSGPSSFHQYSFQGPPVQHPWVPVTPPAPPPPQAVVPGQPPTLVEQRVMHVGTCLTLLSYVLDQLHVTLVQQEVQIGAMQPAEQTAAVAAAEELQHYLPLIGFVPGSPGAALGPGPGALARLAESAQEDPLDLVAAAASVLRWLDGRLCWILIE